VAISKRCGETPCAEILGVFAGYLAPDAWIANTERHHQNWALLQTLSENGVSCAMCPSFDHASSPGHELTDVRRREIMASGIDRYPHHKQSRGAIYWLSTDDHPPQQLELVRRIGRENPALGLPWLARLGAIEVAAWRDVIHSVPETWMTPLAKKFAVSLVEAIRSELLTCLTA
jgi:hypothetical protein